MSSDGAVLHACWQPNLPRTGEPGLSSTELHANSARHASLLCFLASTLPV
jgi:hypothetical protein